MGAMDRPKSGLIGTERLTVRLLLVAVPGDTKITDLRTSSSKSPMCSPRDIVENRLEECMRRDKFPMTESKESDLIKIRAADGA